jgi:hypothetical protein
MPKISLASLPLSGMFAVAKPSGPTSMSVVNDIKTLINNSHLFVDPDKRGQKTSGKRGKRARDAVKIGQGGTLDPLADGVLGKANSDAPSASVSRVFERSHRNWERDEKVERIPGLCEGDCGI